MEKKTNQKNLLSKKQHKSVVNPTTITLPKLSDEELDQVAAGLVPFPRFH
ncbi:MAG: hypothetical protein F6K41_18230 [Symploca sp. SIO3E6]|nr:hypothetical protein [Caldora sp. SIO3E6]